jgi:hypothetical protein
VCSFDTRCRFSSSNMVLISIAFSNGSERQSASTSIYIYIYNALSKLFEVRKVGTRHQGLQERPQIGQVILQRYSREEQPPKGTKHEQYVPSLRPKALDHVRLVQDHVVVPHLALEDVCVPARERVRGDAHVEVVLVVPSLSQLFPTLGAAVITQNLEAGEKLFGLHLPIQQHARRNDLCMRQITRS